jgi:hypothetical protein
MSKYLFVSMDGNKYRLRHSYKSPFGYTVVIWDRIQWKVVDREVAHKVLKFAGHIK